MAAPTSASTIEEALALLRSNPPADFFRCAETLFAVLKRAAPSRPAAPDGGAAVPAAPALGESKHRQLNRQSQTFGASIGAVKGGVRFLRAAGFIDHADGAHLVLPDGADAALVARAKAALKASVAEATAAAVRASDTQRASENAIAAERLVELKRVQRAHQQTRTAVEEAERLRILREMQAERFEKARQEDPHNFC